VIAVDSSALMAIILEEPDADACSAVLTSATQLVISAGTVAEVLIVAAGRNLSGEMEDLIDGLGFVVVPVSWKTARDVAAAHRRWGRGAHPARLNFGDCFAYALAKDQNCPLLFIGDDFARTDIVPAIRP
jgi:ribonuclease VapC